MNSLCRGTAKSRPGSERLAIINERVSLNSSADWQSVGLYNFDLHFRLKESWTIWYDSCLIHWVKVNYSKFKNMHVKTNLLHLLPWILQYNSHNNVFVFYRNQDNQFITKGNHWSYDKYLQNFNSQISSLIFLFHQDYCSRLLFVINALNEKSNISREKKY